MPRKFGDVYHFNLERYTSGTLIVNAIQKTAQKLNWRYFEGHSEMETDIILKTQQRFGGQLETSINPGRRYCQVTFVSPYPLNGELKQFEDKLRSELKSGLKEKKRKSISSLSKQR